MKKLKKALLGFLKYFGVMLGSIVCVVAIMIANFLLTKTPDELTPSPTGSKSENTVEKIITNLEKMENGQFDIDLDIELSDSDCINIATSVVISTQKQVSDVAPVSYGESVNSPAIEISGNVSINDEEVPFVLTYIGETFYAEIGQIFIRYDLKIKYAWRN